MNLVLVPLKIDSAKTISRRTRRNAGEVCFNKFQRSSTVLHALALMRWLWYEMVYEKSSTIWRACRIIVWGWKWSSQEYIPAWPTVFILCTPSSETFFPKRKPTPPPIPETQLWPLSKNFSREAMWTFGNLSSSEQDLSSDSFPSVYQSNNPAPQSAFTV